MIKFVSLISGSSGNATLVSDGKTNLLVDCGTSGKRIEAALEKAGEAKDSINALLITHEHSDHIKGAGVLARRYKLPVYATAATHRAMTGVGKIDDNLRFCVNPGKIFEIGNIGVEPFSISHDAADPVGYSFYIGNEKLTVATDTGFISGDIMDSLRGSGSILLESNHDVEMLRCGPYPYHLQQRILGKKGHLSNNAAAEAALELVCSGTEHIILGHLSEHNNLPEIALMETKQYLEEAGVAVGKDVTLQVAHRYDLTEAYI